MMRVLFARQPVQIVTMNGADRDVLRQWRLVAPERIDVIPGNGIDLGALPILPESDGERVTIAIVARMIEDKGLPTLIEAFQQLKTTNSELLLVGQPDARNPTAISEERLRAWGQLPGVTWIPYVDDVREVWARAHIAVLPSRREGLPVSLLEAAAYGRPLVATDVPGCRDIAVHGETGLTIPVDDAAALARALESLVRSPSLRQAYGRAARSLVKRRFSIEVVTAAVSEHYRQHRSWISKTPSSKGNAPTGPVSASPYPSSIRPNE